MKDKLQMTDTRFKKIVTIVAITIGSFCILATCIIIKKYSIPCEDKKCFDKIKSIIKTIKTKGNAINDPKEKKFTNIYLENMDGGIIQLDYNLQQKNFVFHFLKIQNNALDEKIKNIDKFWSDTTHDKEKINSFISKKIIENLSVVSLGQNIKNSEDTIKMVFIREEKDESLSFLLKKEFLENPMGSQKRKNGLFFNVNRLYERYKDAFNIVSSNKNYIAYIFTKKNKLYFAIEYKQNNLEKNQSLIIYEPIDFYDSGKIYLEAYKVSIAFLYILLKENN